MQVRPSRLSTRFRPLRIPLIAFLRGSFCVGITEIEFGMITLGLNHLGTLFELPRFTAKCRLLFPFARGRLIPPIPVLVRHMPLNTSPRCTGQRAECKQGEPCA